MENVLPPVSLWEQFSVIVILALILIVIGLLARRMFKDFVEWQNQQDKKRDEEREKQDKKRDEEREKQRQWMEMQEQKNEEGRIARDKDWQAFFTQMESSTFRQIDQLTISSLKLANQVERVTELLSEHDSWAKKVYETQSGKRSGEGVRKGPVV